MSDERKLIQPIPWTQEAIDFCNAEDAFQFRRLLRKCCAPVVRLSSGVLFRDRRSSALFNASVDSGGINAGGEAGSPKDEAANGHHHG